MKPVRLVVCVNKRQGLGQKSCAGSGSRELIPILKKQFSKSVLDVSIVAQVCLGRCEEGITMRIAPGGPFFTRVTEQDIPDIIDAVVEFSAVANIKNTPD